MHSSGQTRRGVGMEVICIGHQNINLMTSNDMTFQLNGSLCVFYDDNETNITNGSWGTPEYRTNISYLKYSPIDMRS